MGTLSRSSELVSTHSRGWNPECAAAPACAANAPPRVAAVPLPFAAPTQPHGLQCLPLPASVPANPQATSCQLAEGSTICRPHEAVDAVFRSSTRSIQNICFMLHAPDHHHCRVQGTARPEVTNQHHYLDLRIERMAPRGAAGPSPPPRPQPAAPPVRGPRPPPAETGFRT
jgi:hypothetical protein